MTDDTRWDHNPAEPVRHKAHRYRGRRRAPWSVWARLPAVPKPPGWLLMVPVMLAVWLAVGAVIAHLVPEHPTRLPPGFEALGPYPTPTPTPGRTAAGSTGGRAGRSVPGVQSATQMPAVMPAPATSSSEPTPSPSPSPSPSTSPPVIVIEVTPPDVDPPASVPPPPPADGPDEPMACVPPKDDNGRDG